MDDSKAGMDRVIPCTIRWHSSTLSVGKDMGIFKNMRDGERNGLGGINLGPNKEPKSF